MALSLRDKVLIVIGLVAAISFWVLAGRQPDLNDWGLAYHGACAAWQFAGCDQAKADKFTAWFIAPNSTTARFYSIADLCNMSGATQNGLDFHSCMKFCCAC